MMSGGKTHNKRLTNIGFNQLLILVVSLGILLLTLITTLVSSNITSRELHQRIQQEGLQLTESFVESARLGLLYQSRVDSKNAVDTLLLFPDIQGAAVYIGQTKDNILYADGMDKKNPQIEQWPESTTLIHEDDNVWIYAAPVFTGTETSIDPFSDPIEPELIGHVKLIQSKASLKSMLQNIYLINVATSFAVAVILLIILLYITNRVTKPVLNLASIMRRAQEGEKNLHANLEGTREIVEMESAFNTMMEVLQQREKELQTARDMALEAARIKGEFAANVSHELRTPMNGILGMLELMNDLGLPAQQEEYLEIATSSAEALLALIDDILNFSKTDAGKVSLENSSFDLVDLLEETVTLLSVQAQRKELQLSFVCDHGIPPVLIGDEGRLRQILVNLLGNGIKFTDWGEVSVAVDILDRVEQAQDNRFTLTLQFTVSDTGIGMSDTDKAKIFDAFSQVDSSTTKRYEGTGLGLAITRQLVQLMQGDIQVVSEIGQGSQFIFTVQLEAIESSRRSPEFSLLDKDINILVIDGNDNNRLFLEQQLARIEVSSQTMSNSSEVLQLLREPEKQNFDAFFIDENISEIRADELATLITNNANYSSVPVFILVNQHNALTGQYKANNISGFIRKPINREELFRAISNLINHVNFDNQLTETNNSATSNSPVSASYIGARVLVVEDNRSNQKVAIGMLERLGCTAQIANNGREAVESLSRHDYDVILMDCHMPEMDGYETTAKIRSLDSDKSRTPIIAMTANVQAGEHEKCLAVGMDDFLSKPLKLQKIKEALERWTESKIFSLADNLDISVDTASDGNNADNVLDQKILLELESSIGDSINQVLEYSLKDISLYLTDLEEQINANDTAAWTNTAHTMKGTAINIGAKHLYELCEEIEQRGRDGNSNDIVELLEKVRNETGIVCKSIIIESIKRGAYNESHQAQSIRPADPDFSARILVVDDDKSIRLSIRETIEKTGHRVDEVANGEQALMYCERFMPDLILMDAVMPEIDGFSASKKIMDLPGGENVTIIMITALHDEGSISKAFASGATDYVTKPINYAVLKKRVTRLLQAKNAENHIRELAFNDPLTGLPNRKYFTDKLEQHIAKTRVGDEVLAILFLDLDRFKLINDTFGHDSGDLLLKVVAERLVGCVRQGDMVSRFGGDEFVIMLNRVKSYSAIEAIAAKIHQALARPFVFLGKELRITTSIGIATYPDNGDHINILLKNADLAMYRAKRQGNRYEFYESKMEDESSRRLSLENDLRSAIERGEMELYYQPQFDCQSGQIIGAEALVRWNHPDNGLVSPVDFIGVAEETGQIHELGTWILSQACQQAQEWQQQFGKQLHMAVNISGKQLDRGDLDQVVNETLSSTGLDPKMLELEVTESSIMENAENVISCLEKLKAMGVSIAIDDFGTGYSSLSYLRRFPIDLLKIDREFVRNVGSNKVDADIVSTIITLAHTLSVKVLAEGVETEEQRSFLTDNDCDSLQGYLFSKPLPAKQFQNDYLA